MPSRIFATSTAANLLSSLETARAQTSHGPTIGNAAEEAVRRWFEQHLSSAFAVSTGQLVDSDDQVSAQTDVVVLRQDIHPHTWGRDLPNLFIPDATRAVGEVKAHLGSDDLVDAVGKARSWRRLRVEDPEGALLLTTDENEPAPSDPIWDTMRLPAFLLAFESDLSLSTVAERALRPSGERLFDGIFLLDRGCVIQVPLFGGLADLLGGVPGERLEIADPTLVMLALLAWITAEPRMVFPQPGAGVWRRYLKPVFASTQ